MAIYFKGSDAYRQQTYSVFASVESNPVGHIIITSIRNTGKDLTFEPYADNDCQATTTALDYKGSAPKGVGGGPASNAPWYRGHDDNPMTREDERYDSLKERGTGEGSDVRMNYSPSTWGEGPKACFSGDYASKADEILLHEMVHALRHMQGKSNAIPTEDNSLWGYGNEEEWLAIVTTNVYISAKGGTRFRANHAGHTALSSSLSTSDGFLSDPMNRKLMNIYRLTWTMQFLALTNVVTAKFNPFRELSIKNRDYPVGDMWQQMYVERLLPRQ